MAPTLGQKSSETDIDRANQWLRSQPFYLEFIRSIGQDPSYVHLNDAQKKQFAQIAAANGLPLPSNDEIDPAGNINPKGHKMRNFLIAAAIGGAAVGGYYALPALTGGGGAAGAGAAGAAGTGAGGTLAATTTAPLVGSLAAGGVASGAVPAALAAGSGAAAAGGGAALGASSGLGALGWASLAGNVGSQAVGAYLQNKGINAEAEGNREALDFTKKVYEQERADSAPYRALGQGSVQTLAQLMGQPQAPQGYNPNAPQGPNQAPPPAAPGVNVGDPRLGAGVLMVAPTGEEKLVPSDQVQHWISKGASVKSGGASTGMAPAQSLGARMAQPRGQGMV